MANPMRKFHVRVWVDGVLEVDMLTMGGEPSHSLVVVQTERTLAMSGMKDVEVYNWEVVPNGEEK